jgi:hypothetical protein
MDQATEMVARLLNPDPLEAPVGASLAEWEDLLVRQSDRLAKNG